MTTINNILDKNKYLSSIVFFIVGLFSPTALYFFLITLIITKKENSKFLFSWFVLSHVALAYNWIPWNDSFDLTRFHSTVVSIGSMSSKDIINNMLTLFAPFIFIMSYITFLIGDVNFLQASVTLMTLSLVFYHLNYYITKYDLSGYKKNLAFAIVYFTLPVLRVISGLWSILSMSYIAFIFLLRNEGYIKSEWKFVLLFYISTLIHFGSIIPFSIYIYVKIFNINSIKKILISILVVFASMLLILPISNLMYTLTNMEIFALIHSRFNAYVFNQENFGYLNNYRFIIVEQSKSILCFIFIIKSMKNEELLSSELKDNNFRLFLLIVTFIFGMFIRILLRFTLLSVLLFIPLIFRYIKDIEIIKNKIRLSEVYLLMFLVLNILYQYYALFNARMF